MEQTPCFHSDIARQGQINYRTHNDMAYSNNIASYIKMGWRGRACKSCSYYLRAILKKICFEFSQQAKEIVETKYLHALEP